jgi:hypothetical protein
MAPPEWQLLVFGAMVAAITSAFWWATVGSWYRRQVEMLRLRQDIHERETQRWVADWAAAHSDISELEWYVLLYSLQQELHRMAGVRREV